MAELLNIDPKDILGPDLYNYVQSDQGKAIGNGMAAIGAAAVTGNTGAMWAASEAMMVTAVTFINPVAGAVVGAFFGFVDAFKASGGNYVDPVCTSGSVKTGYPPQSEIDGWVAPGSDAVGTYQPWILDSLDLEPDAFLKAVRALQGTQEGKARNCYKDFIGTSDGAVDYAKIWAIALASWNAAHVGGQKVTITRTIRGVDTQQNVQGFGGKSTHPIGPIPSDWDANDRKYADNPNALVNVFGTNMGTGVITYAQICTFLYRAQAGIPNESGIDYRDAPQVSIDILMPPPMHFTLHNITNPPKISPLHNISPSAIIRAAAVVPTPPTRRRSWLHVPEWAGTAGGAAVGFYLGGPIGLAIGAGAGAGVDLLRKHGFGLLKKI